MCINIGPLAYVSNEMIRKRRKERDEPEREERKDKD